MKQNVLNTTVLELTGNMKRLTPAESAKAVRNPFKSCTMRDSPSEMVEKRGPYVNDTLVKIEYNIAGNCKAGTFARSVLTNQILANSHMAQTLRRS
jgi:hypothetical protein